MTFSSSLHLQIIQERFSLSLSLSLSHLLGGGFHFLLYHVEYVDFVTFVAIASLVYF